MSSLHNPENTNNSHAAHPSLGKRTEEPSTTDDGSFHTSENILEDGSATYDVYFSSSYGQEMIAEPPSQDTAECLADALNVIRKRFLDCKSDREAKSLRNNLLTWVESHTK